MHSKDEEVFKRLIELPLLRPTLIPSRTLPGLDRREEKMETNLTLWAFSIITFSISLFELKRIRQFIIRMASKT